MLCLSIFFTRELGFAGISLCGLSQAYEFCFQKPVFLPDNDLFLEETAISSRIREMASSEWTYWRRTFHLLHMTGVKYEDISKASWQSQAGTVLDFGFNNVDNTLITCCCWVGLGLKQGLSLLFLQSFLKLSFYQMY